MSRHLGAVALLVRDYDQAIAWFTQKLGFVLIEDTPRGPGKRWVVVAPTPDSATRLLLSRAADLRQQAAVGNQSGGRVFLFLHSADFDRDHAAMVERGVQFMELPRTESYGKVAVFEDLYGNRWDLLEHRR